MKKFLAVVFILILIFMIGCGGTEEAKETYTELFVGVTQTDATEILERLKNIGVTNAIYDNETIYVIEHQVDLIREQWVLQGTAGQAYDSLDGTWELSSESLKEINTDDSYYQVISHALTFSGETVSRTHMVEYRVDEIVAMSDEEISPYGEIIERGKDYVIVNVPSEGIFSLTDDGTGLVIEGEEHTTLFSRISKNIILLNEATYVRL